MVDKKQIEKNFLVCNKIIERIRADINNQKCQACCSCNELTNLHQALISLSESIREIFPMEAEFLQAYLISLVGVQKIRSYDFGGIMAVVNIIGAKYVDYIDSTTSISVNSTLKKKKIFISHASKDKVFIQAFVDDILQLGIGIDANDIFCTSIEDMAIKNGEEIRKHIQQNIRNVDFAFLMISKNYRASEICLNEMGAVWAYDNNVKLYLLPDANFDDIGWLCNTRIAEKINDSIALDALHEQLQQHYSLQDTSIRSWSRQREKFLQEIKDFTSE